MNIQSIKHQNNQPNFQARLFVSGKIGNNKHTSDVKEAIEFIKKEIKAIPGYDRYLLDELDSNQLIKTPEQDVFVRGCVFQITPIDEGKDYTSSYISAAVQPVIYSDCIMKDGKIVEETPRSKEQIRESAQCLIDDIKIYGGNHDYREEW